MFSGSGTANTEVFDSPPKLPWVIDWVAEGTGPNSMVVTLMDPDNDSELLEIVSKTGNGQLGESSLIWGSMGTFYLKVEGPDAGWQIWIKQQ